MLIKTKQYYYENIYIVQVVSYVYSPTDLTEYRAVNESNAPELSVNSIRIAGPLLIIGGGIGFDLQNFNISGASDSGPSKIRNIVWNKSPEHCILVLLVVPTILFSKGCTISIRVKVNVTFD